MKSDEASSKRLRLGGEKYRKDVFGDSDDTVKTEVLGGHSDYRDQDQQDDTSEYYYYISDYDYNEAENTGIDLQSVKPKLWETKPMYEYVYNRELKETQKGQLWKG